MGNSNGDEYDPNFDPRKYTKKGMTLDEILCIRKSFLQFSPNNRGYISV